MWLYTGHMSLIQPSSCISTKQWFPHPDSIITCCTKRNQAPLWTSLPQTHRWACYYSNSPEFAGKEGLSLWHTSCPLKRPTERWLCGALFPSFAFDACERGGGGGLKPEFHLMDVNPQTSNQPPLLWDAVILARHIIKSENKLSKYLALIEAFVKSSGDLSSDSCCDSSFMVRGTKAKFFRHLPDWCRYLLTWGSSYLGGQL